MHGRPDRPILSLVWAPASDRLAYADKDGRLFVHDLTRREIREIDDSAHGPILDATFSPDGEFLAYSKRDDRDLSTVFVWSRRRGPPLPLTDRSVHAFSPGWHPDGTALFFLREEEPRLRLDPREWNVQFERRSTAYRIAWDVGSVEPSRRATPPPAIPLAELRDRIERIPLPPARYLRLDVTHDALLLLEGGEVHYDESPSAVGNLVRFDPARKTILTLKHGVESYRLSGSCHRVLVRDGAGRELVLDLRSRPAVEERPVPRDGLVADIDPREEWRQIFAEVWRRYRDYFYVPTMRGVSWESVRRKYEPLLPHVPDRRTLSELLGRMAGELGTSHATVEGGDNPTFTRPTGSLLGLRFETDGSTGLCRVARVLTGDPSDAKIRGPGSRIRKGEFVLEIDGRSLEPGENAYRYLRNRDQEPVTLLLGTSPDPAGARRVLLDPVPTEVPLLYREWVAEQRGLVAAEVVRQGNRRTVGYVHLPDMGAWGLREFFRQFFPATRNEAILLDLRHNAGGNAAPVILDRLRREVFLLEFSRTSDRVGVPRTAYHGHFICLVNENTASDGEIFAHGFRTLQLGQIVGSRTWGGVVGFLDRGPLLDGGRVYVPEFGKGALDGSWILEGTGVLPDVTIPSWPDEKIDAGIEAATRLLIQAAERYPKDLPTQPREARR